LRRRAGAGNLLGVGLGRTALIIQLAVSGLLTSGCASGASRSCADLRTQRDEISKQTRDVASWQNIEDLQKAVTQAERLSAEIVSRCSA
jgi:hypothetical protein